MATSQNGWSVVDSAPAFVVHGVTFPNGVRGGDVAIVLRWTVEQWHARVEKLVAGSCWGYDKKKISGSDEWSNHASATAVDCNASRHPQGVPASRNMSAHQIDQCHAIEAESGGVVRWGGDFSRPDPMHWEINANAAAVAAFARRIEDEMTKEELKDALEDFFARGTQDGKPGGPVTSKIGRDALDQGVPNVFAGGKSSAWALLGDIAEHVKALEAKVDKLS